MSDTSAANSYLLVPMNVEALVVGTAAGLWTDLHPDFSLMARGKILGSQLAPALFDARPQIVGNPDPQRPFAPQGPQPGVHLHWALPDALTRGRQKRPANPQEPRGAPEFPFIPNRWMVQRIWRKPQTNSPPSTSPGSPVEISVRAWVVESDYLYGTRKRDEEVDAVAFPRPDEFALFDYVGKSFDYPNWSERQPAYRIIPLTALGYGDPAFAAYYPACKSILGFYDPLTDIDQETTFSYLVAGWYSDPAKDVLRHLTLEELKWATASTTGSSPTQVLCHGTIYNVQWKNRTFSYSTSVPIVDDEDPAVTASQTGADDQYRIALGNTTTEALAALLAQKLENPSIESLLAAFQEQLSEKAELAELDFSLHQQRFGSLAGGREFAIQKKQAGADESPTATDATLPESLEKLLAQLNALEREFERHRREWDGYRWELYAMWHTWAKVYAESESRPRTEPKEITSKISALRDVVEDRKVQLGTLKSRRDAAERAVRDAVEQQFADLEFVSSPAAPFWLANDPVLLISGPGLVLSQRHGQDGRYSEKDQLHCRVTGQELGSLFVGIPNGRQGLEVGAADVFKVAGNPFGGGPVPKGITDALLFEALLLDPAHADAIAEQAYVKAQLRTRHEKDVLIGRIRLLQRPKTWTLEVAAGGTTAGYGGTYPSPVALRDWECNPWLPLFVEWQIAWYPSYTTPANPLEHWQLGADDVDFRWTGNSPDLTRPYTYGGYSILGPHAVQQFKERLRKYNRDNPGQDLSPALTNLDHMPVLGQSLGGLTDAFIMRDQCLQIVPINPAYFATKKESRHSIIGSVEGVNDVSPDPDKPFLPIRAGHLKVLAVAVVDAFGQTLQLRNFDHPVRAASLATDRAKPLMRFAPRLAQPLRLRFNWSPTLNPLGTYPIDSPVCGWVIPNHLDKNVTFYDARGTALGALQKILRASAAGGTGGKAREDDKAFFWVPMPGTSHQPKDILNPHLRHFVQFLESMNVGAGNAFWNLLDDALGKTDSGEPEDDPLLSLLLGRPLALVRAELGFELAGRPACDQGLKALGQFDSKGFTKVKFPVQLGEAQKDTDGLVGYFTDDPEAKTAGAFYPASGATGTDYQGAIEYGHVLALDCETPLAVTLLMDPRAKVHAVTGLLPKKAVTLPPRASSAAKSAKEAFFQVAPLVSPGGLVSMPKPSDDYGKWSWAYRPQVTGWQEVENVSSTADQAGFAPQPQQLSEGWLKLRMNPLAILNFWVKEGTLVVQPKTNITLGWTLSGGNRVSLAAIEEGQKPRPVEQWSSSPLPEQCRVHVEAQTTYVLVLEDKDGNRSEKRLTIAIKGANGHA